MVAMAEGVKEFTDSNFETEVLKSQEPVLVDFWAPWCGPCRMIAPLVEEMAGKYAGSVKIGKVNIDENPNSAARYGVMSIPTLLVFKGGNVVQTLVGLQSKQKLEGVLDQAKA
jgi:thioredoxin 1